MAVFTAIAASLTTALTGVLGATLAGVAAHVVIGVALVGEARQVGTQTK